MKRLILLGIGSLVCLLSFSQSKEAEKTVQDTNVAQPTVATDSNQIDDDYIHIKVEKIAEFPGGTKELMTFLRSNIKYPEKALKKNIEGKVILQFVVKKNGSIKDIVVTRSVHPLLDAEAIRVVKKMPKWKPAEVNGKAVNSRYTLPFLFHLK